MPFKLYKSIYPLIAPLFSDNFNKCFEAGIFPTILKKANVLLIFKSGQKDLTSTYRPVSILSQTAKIFEKLLYVQIENYFSSLKIISSQQSGFRKVYSTEMAIIDLQSTF